MYNINNAIYFCCYHFIITIKNFSQLDYVAFVKSLLKLCLSCLQDLKPFSLASHFATEISNFVIHLKKCFLIKRSCRCTSHKKIIENVESVFLHNLYYILNR